MASAPSRDVGDADGDHDGPGGTEQPQADRAEGRLSQRQRQRDPAGRAEPAQQAMREMVLSA